MKKLLLILSVIFCITGISYSQFRLEPSVGYQSDLFNYKSQLVNGGLQLAWRHRKVEFLFQVQHSWIRQSGSSIDSSYTTKPNLPLNAPAARIVRPTIFTTGFGCRYKLAGKNGPNSLYGNVYGGYMYQGLEISYQYDRVNYIVLNPVQTQDHRGFYMSAGFEYMRQLKTGRIFCDLNFCSPPTVFKAEARLVSIAPETFSIGYSIQLSKK